MTAEDSGLAAFAPLKSPALSVRVSHELICAVLRGTFAPSTLLPREESLCQQFQVSRPVIREAIKTLASIGMVRTRQGQGSTVLDESNWNELAPELLLARYESGIVHDVLAEVLELRALLEVQCAERAATRVGQEDIAVLNGHLEAMKSSLDSRQAFLAHDLEFHRELVRIAGNRLVLRLFYLLEPMLVAARAITLEHQRLPDGMIDGIDEHQAIIQALTDGSPAMASKAMERHLSSIGGRVAEFDDNPN